MKGVKRNCFILLLWLFLPLTSLQAYKIGDSVDTTIIQSLQLESGKIAVISFFASWCNTCRHEIPQLIKVYTLLHNEHIDFIGVDVDKDITKGKAFQSALMIPFRVVDDTDHRLITQFDPVGIPAIYILKGSKIRHIITGGVEKLDSELHQRITAIQ